MSGYEDAMDNDLSYDETDAHELRDERVFSDDPKEWDKVEGLGAGHVGYYSLPEFYLLLREKYRFPFEKKTVLFESGVFVEVLPGQGAADVYANYKANIDYRLCEKWWDTIHGRSLPELRLADRREKNPKPYWITDGSIDKMKFDISEFMLKSLQGKKGMIRGGDLETAYGHAVCGNKEIEKFAPYGNLLRDKIFTGLVSKWYYSYKIARLLENPDWRGILRKKELEMIGRNKVSISKKWYGDYKDYSAGAEVRENYALEMNSCFQNIEAGQPSDGKESFLILKKDLFDPMSEFYIRNVIEAFRNKDWGKQSLVVPETLDVRNGRDSHRIVFCVREKNGKYGTVDCGKIGPDDSVYSLDDRGFRRVADWQKKLSMQR